jgi:hypothetical protein
MQAAGLYAMQDCECPKRIKTGNDFYRRAPLHEDFRDQKERRRVQAAFPGLPFRHLDQFAPAIVVGRKARVVLARCCKHRKVART